MSEKVKSIEVGGEVSEAGTIQVSRGPIVAAIDRAGPHEDATHATVVSSDGYRASIPLEMLRAGGVLSIDDAGLRLRVVDGHTLCWNVKDVARIEVTVGKQPDDVPAKPTH